MNPVELKMRRRMVKAFIDADPVDVAFTREAKVQTPAGGWTTERQPPLAPQRGRIVPSKRRYASEFVNTEEGEIRRWPYALLGRYDMDIQSGDTFTWQGQLYVVKTIESDREERTLAAVDMHGGG